MENEEFEENVEKLIFSEDDLEREKSNLRNSMLPAPPEKRKGSFIEGFLILLACHFICFCGLLLLPKIKVSDACSLFFSFIWFFQIAYVFPLSRILFWGSSHSIGKESEKGYWFAVILTFCLSIVFCLILFPDFFTKLFKQNT